MRSIIVGVIYQDPPRETLMGRNGTNAPLVLSFKNQITFIEFFLVVYFGVNEVIINAVD